MPPPVDEPGYPGRPSRLPPPSWPVPPTSPERWNAALFEEVRKGHGLNVPMLLRHGAAVNAYDVETLGYALIAAVESRQPAMVPILLDSGADVNFATHENGDTALLTAIGDEEWHLAAVLLALGADPNLPDPITKNTPLMVAIIEEDWLAAHLLVHHGADVNIPHADTGQTPWLLAQTLGHGPTLSEILALCGHPAAPSACPPTPRTQPPPAVAPGQQDAADLPGAIGGAEIEDPGPYLSSVGPAPDIEACQQARPDIESIGGPAEPTGLPPLHGPWQHH